MSRLPHEGQVTGIYLRPERLAAVVPADSVEASSAEGLIGDHHSGRYDKRQVTLIQHEDLGVVAAFLRLDNLNATRLRRNIVVRGINLIALKGKRFHIGDAVFEGTGPCDPCSRMEQELGPGGFNAMRGRGGITARVVKGGWIFISDAVRAV